MWGDRAQHPTAYLYRQAYSGQPVDPLRLSFITRKYLQHAQQEFVQQMCAMFGQVAVASRLLTRRQREKYRGNRIRAGGTVYYVFPADRVPADVGAAVEMEPGVTLYA